MTRITSALVLAFAAAPLVAQVDAAPAKAPSQTKSYSVTLSKAANAAKAAQAIEKMKAVEKVAANGAVLSITTKYRKKAKRHAYLPESRVRAMLAKAGCKVKSMKRPSWAEVTVWVANASGGG